MLIISSIQRDNKHNCVLSNAGLSNALTKTGVCTSLKSDFYFRFHSPLNTNSALLNFICTWDLVLISSQMWSWEPENCQNRNPPKIGKLLPVCVTNNRRRNDHISDPHAKFGERLDGKHGLDWTYSRNEVDRHESTSAVRRLIPARSVFRLPDGGTPAHVNETVYIRPPWLPPCYITFETTVGEDGDVEYWFWGRCRRSSFVGRSRFAGRRLFGYLADFTSTAH